MATEESDQEELSKTNVSEVSEKELTIYDSPDKVPMKELRYISMATLMSILPLPTRILIKIRQLQPDTGLCLSYFVANFQFMALITSLTDDWQLSLFSAVIITNVKEGAKGFLVIPLTWLADTYLGDNLTLIISAAIYIIGMVMWWPLAFSYFTDPSYVWGFFSAALLLITIGQCGYDIYTKENDEFEKFEQVVANNQEEKRDVEQGGCNHQEKGRGRAELITLDRKDRYVPIYRKACKILWILFKYNWIKALGLAIAIFLPGPPWVVICMMAVGFVILIIVKNPLKVYQKPERSPFSAIFKVLWIAYKKRCDKRGTSRYIGVNPENSDDGREKNSSGVDHENNSNGHDNDTSGDDHGQNVLTDRFRYLNIAALYDPSSVKNPKVEFDKGRLCTVQQVEDTKRFITSICLSMVFLTYGVMSAVGDTFFIEKVHDMNTTIGNFEVPIQLFVLTSDGIRKLVSFMCHWIVAKKVNAPLKRFYGTRRVGLGILLSVPCFVIASVIEVKLLKEKRLGREICVLWLTPQLILLGIMDGLAIDGIEGFFKKEMPDSIGNSYSDILAEGIIGLGKLLGVGWFCLWYFASKIGGKRGWFGDDIESIRLDYYYMIMGAFGLISFIFFIWMNTFKKGS